MIPPATEGLLSKFALSDLALQSAVELEKARVGAHFEKEPLEALARALSKTSRADSEGLPFKFVEPGYYEPYGRLYRQAAENRAQSVEQIQEFVGQAAERLRAFTQPTAEIGAVADLVVFCIALHRELIRELTSEEGNVGEDRRIPDLTAPSSFR